ncbi:MAG: hypothetical protein ACFB10_20535 [Salibacteraceae bacterium]
MAKKVTDYTILVTRSAESRYRRQILSYLKTHFTTSRVEEIDRSLIKCLRSLSKMPYRGQKEPLLNQEKEMPRFLLFKETPNVTIKILYYIQENQKQVVVTDFFPVRKNPKGMVEP